MRGRGRALILSLVAVGVLGACEPNTVRIAYRPPSGATYRYAVTVRSVTVTRLGDAPPERTVEEADFEADNTVLSTEGGEVRVEVRLRRAGSSDRTFVVLFDRDAQVAAVENVEGLPPAVVGPLGLPEILPAAAGAPPNRPLEPGERWTIDAAPRLPGVGAARLAGTGRLTELRVVDGREVANTRAETRLPLSSTSDVRGGRLTLQGVETTETESTRLVADGSVEAASSTTEGSFDVILNPPSADQGPPVTGTLTIEVRSQTRRLRP